MAKNSQETSILIVDDTETNVRLLTQVVKSEGYKTMTANSGQEALDIVEEKKPDLILLDVMMPDMNGFEVCKKLKEEKEYRQIPVIFLSALSETDSKIKGFQVGGVDYITKPFQRQEVMARIDLHVKLKRLQGELEEKVEALKERESRLKRLNEEKDEVMRIVSHDFKNPVSGILGLVEMLLKSDSDFSEDERMDIYKAMKESGRKLIDLVNNLLSKDSDSSISTLNISKTNLNKLIDEVIELHKPSAMEKRVDIHKELKDEVSLQIDKHKIEQVLSNLISNSLKFTPADGTITVSMQRTNSSKGKVRLTVSDNGIGMSEEQLNSLWEEGVDNRRVGTSGEKGTGIGLQLVKNFIDMHNGEIEVESEENQGTTFQIIL